MRARRALRLTATALVTVLVAITVNFIIFRAAPGDAVTNMAAVPRASVQEKRALRHEFGLDKPKLTQYWLYLRALVHGNLGRSFASRQPVTTTLRTAILNTLPMVLLGTLLAIAVGTVIGVAAAYHRGSAGDHLGVGGALFAYAVPIQCIGLLLILLCSGFLPTGGMSDEFLVDPSPATHLVDVGRHMVLPSLTLALALIGQFTLIARSSMLEVLGEDYILTARAKGLRRRAILTRHALRNALLPLVTLGALSLGTVVGGAVLVETVFSWPGIGREVYTAVGQRDYPVLQGAFLVLTVSVIFFNYLADMINLRLDPRISR
jgi:ABC-type dipeptide/oligopeptide/nickel transport system permease component